MNIQLFFPIRSSAPCYFPSYQEQRPLLPVGVRLDQSLEDQVKSMAASMPTDGDLVAKQDKAHRLYLSMKQTQIIQQNWLGSFHSNLKLMWPHQQNHAPPVRSWKVPGKGMNPMTRMEETLLKTTRSPKPRSHVLRQSQVWRQRQSLRRTAALSWCIMRELLQNIFMNNRIWIYYNLTNYSAVDTKLLVWILGWAIWDTWYIKVCRIIIII